MKDWQRGVLGGTFMVFCLGLFAWLFNAIPLKHLIWLPLGTLAIIFFIGGYFGAIEDKKEMEAETGQTDSKGNR